MRCGISTSTNRPSPLNSQDRVSKLLAVRSHNTASTTGSSISKSHLLRSESSYFGKCEDTAHLRAIGCSEIGTENSCSADCVIIQ